MTRFVVGRILWAIPVVLGVSIFVFSMLHFLPSDPAELMLGEIGATKEAIERLRRQLGLNDPLYVQYGRFLWRALHGDLGESVRTRRPVTWYIHSQVRGTIELTLAGMGLAIVLGVALGILAAVNRQGWLDTFSMFVALWGLSIPNFWLGLILIYTFALRLGWFPITGEGAGSLLVLPACALGFQAAAVIARLTRSSMLEVLRQEYVTTARSKGLAEAIVILRHALRNALIPVVTIVGLQFGSLLGGAVTIETVFARRGLGRLLVEAILAKDFPMVQGLVLLAAMIYVVVNLAVDLSYAWLDPRIRYGTE